MTLFQQLCTKLQAIPFGRRYLATCPWCGHPPTDKHGRLAIHFSIWDGNKAGCKCFVCGAGCGHVALAQYLELPKGDSPAYVTPVKQQPIKAANWIENPEPYLSRYSTPLTLFDDWYTYKQLTPQTIAQWRLGRGRLPFLDAETGKEYNGKYDRLIVPTFDGERCVGLEGRLLHPDDTGAKWLCATGTRKDVLFNASYLRPDATVIIAENKIDCILAMQHNSAVVAVTGGGSFWLDQWTELIAQSRPKRVIVWRDNDLVGQPNSWTYRVLIAQWRQKTQERIQGKNLPMPTEPTAMGPVIANQFLHYGIKTTLYQWPQNTPAKADLGWALIQG